MAAAAKRREVEEVSHVAHAALAAREEELVGLRGEVELLSEQVVRLKQDAALEAETMAAERNAITQQFKMYEERDAERERQVRRGERDEADRRRNHLSRVTLLRIMHRRLIQACWRWRDNTQEQISIKAKSQKII